MIRPKYPYGWYLRYLLVWYIVFYAVMKVEVLRTHRIIVFGGVSVFLFCLEPELQVEQSLSFLTGIVLSDYKKIREKIADVRIGIIWLVIGVGFLALKQLVEVRNSPEFVFNFVQLMIKLSGAIGVCSVFYWISQRLNLRYLAWIGAASYELYLVHGYLLSHFPATTIGEIMFLLITFILAYLLHIAQFFFKRYLRKKKIL